jgi:hypothetical protein
LDEAFGFGFEDIGVSTFPQCLPFEFGRNLVALSERQMFAPNEMLLAISDNRVVFL